MLWCLHPIFWGGVTMVTMVTMQAQTEECREYLDYFERVCAARDVMHAQINSSLRRAHLAVNQFVRNKARHQERFGDVLQQLITQPLKSTTTPAGWVVC